MRRLFLPGIPLPPLPFDSFPRQSLRIQAFLKASKHLPGSGPAGQIIGASEWKNVSGFSV